jgi:hypothetical protein
MVRDFERLRETRVRDFERLRETRVRDHERPRETTRDYERLKNIKINNQF